MSAIEDAARQQAIDADPLARVIHDSIEALPHAQRLYPDLTPFEWRKPYGPLFLIPTTTSLETNHHDHHRDPKVVDQPSLPVVRSRSPNIPRWARILWVCGLQPGRAPTPRDDQSLRGSRSSISIHQGRTTMSGISVTQVLDNKAHLIERLGTRSFSVFMESFLQDMVAKNQLVPKGEMGNFWCWSETRRLEMADNYHVTDEMVWMIAQTSVELDGTDSFRRDMMPSEIGFAWFDEALHVTDIWGQQTPVVAMSWHCRNAGIGREDGSEGEVAGVWITAYADTQHPRDPLRLARIKAGEDPDNSRHVIGRLQPFDVAFIAWGEKVGPLQIEIADEDLSKYLDALYEANQSDEVIRTLYEGKSIPKECTNPKRLYLAFWTLLNQEIVVLRDEPIPRAARRRMDRAKLPSRVTTIMLRRASYEQRLPGESLRQYMHRWPVRGKYQWRHCGQDHPLAEPYEKGWHARVWVRGYIKGPQGAPLIQTTKVNRLSR